MEKQSTKQLRILPLCLIAIVAIFTFGFLIKMSFEMRAEEYYQDHQGKIYGREYIENGIIFDVPKTGDPSREAAVVKFPNHAVIPGQRRNSVTGLSKIDRQTVGFLIRIS